MKHTRRKAHVVVAEGHDLARIGLVGVLQTMRDVRVVAEVSDAAGTLAAVRTYDPDLVLLDVRMPDLDGLDAARQIRAIRPRARVIVVTPWNEDAPLQEALLAGASGHLSKGETLEAITSEIRRVLGGEPLRPPQAGRQILAEVTRATPPDAQVLVGRLTQRQREVLSLVAAGLTVPQIGKRLGISSHTARTLAQQVRERLGVSNKTQAAMFWFAAALQPSWYETTDPDGRTAVGF
jgi:DNA-binding NarL/FixJ family response regulator